ncbi:MAG: ATP-binding protein, partial [Verrucomicrobiota bacterium]
DIISTQQNYAKTAGVVERIDLEETIRQALKLNEHSINRENCVVETKVDDCPPIQSERPKLQQILLNLLQNAQWACGENSETMGRVQILAYSSDTSHVVIEVKDNGVGIEAENINKVFSHGFTTRKNNNGFGLHTVETLSKQLHGTIKAHSDGPSQGASFRLTVPIDPTVQASETKAWLDSQTPPIRAPK